jgi:hypothetical protein
MYIANKIGDARQPYRIPLVVLNGVVGPEDPITTTSPKSVARLINLYKGESAMPRYDKI